MDVRHLESNEEHICDETNLSFAGCGFVGIYHIGASVCLQLHAPHLLHCNVHITLSYFICFILSEVRIYCLMVLKCLKIQLIIQVFLKLGRSIVLLFKVFIPDDRSHTHTNRKCQCNVKGVKYLMILISCQT